jgi:hypothetical protein
MVHGATSWKAEAAGPDGADRSHSDVEDINWLGLAPQQAGDARMAPTVEKSISAYESAHCRQWREKRSVMA